jgi:hypothetical protein
MYTRDTLHRAALLLMKRGKAKSVDEAYEMLRRYHITVAVGLDAANTSSGQACLLSVINTAVRACIGGVSVVGIQGDESALTPLTLMASVSDAVVELGGRIITEPPENTPLIIIGNYKGNVAGGPIVRATFGGFAGGVIPIEEDFQLAEDSDFPPSAIFAGVLAVAECFAVLLDGNVLAGQRALGLNLYDPHNDWRNLKSARGVLLPADLWLLGLGHLGQAYAWTLGALPYAAGTKPRFYLQDFDLANEANLSTSVLTSQDDLEELKTRITAKWLEERGFTTRLIERRFDKDLKRNPDEPNILLCGVDNPATRRLLENPGFDLVIDAGLGASAADYDGFALHTFTSRGRAKDAYPDSDRPQKRQLRDDKSQSAIEGLGKDQCGLYWGLEVAVGVPFVGVAVSCLVITQIVRAIDGAPLLDTLSGALNCLDLVDFYSDGITIRNPGYKVPDIISIK